MPLHLCLQSTAFQGTAQQVWYADDASASGKMANLHKWWDKLCSLSHSFGYYPNLSKTQLFPKSDFEVVAAEVLMK